MEEPAMLVMANAGRLAQMIDGDAPVAGIAAPSAMAPARPAPPRVPAPAVRPQRAVPQHHVGDSGAMTANRKGVHLCGAFQSGSCTEIDRQGRCAKDANKSHQFAKCLAPGHGADKCNQAPAREPRRNHKGGGKVVGKGGGKGKAQY